MNFNTIFFFFLKASFFVFSRQIQCIFIVFQIFAVFFFFVLLWTSTYFFFLKASFFYCSLIDFTPLSPSTILINYFFNQLKKNSTVRKYVKVQLEVANCKFYWDKIQLCFQPILSDKVYYGAYFSFFLEEEYEKHIFLSSPKKVSKMKRTWRIVSTVPPHESTNCCTVKYIYIYIILVTDSNKVTPNSKFDV